MKNVDLSILELMFVAATRGMAGAGIGLLLGDRLTSRERRTVGWTLLAIGALTTVPIASTLLGRARRPQLAD